ncbi:methyl-accepting chemotaxis protein [Bdellovibrionota bacterium FG-1]
MSFLKSFLVGGQRSVDWSGFAGSFRKILDRSRELYQVSESLKKIVVEEGAAVEKSASALEEISSMVAKTASHTKELAASSQRASGVVNEGQTALSEVAVKMDGILGASTRLQTVVDEASGGLEAVLKALEEIRNRSAMINDIVFQTKLLSFNASVEAARAGEHGKGFSVVAEEIGKLAQSSGAASKEIEEILDVNTTRTAKIVKELKETLRAIARETSESVESGRKSSQVCADVFQRIVTEVAHVSQMAEEISTATNEQEKGVVEVADAVKSLERNSRSLNEMAGKTLSNSVQLSEDVQRQEETIVAYAKSAGQVVEFSEEAFDFDSAITAHLDWKMKLSKYLQKPDGSLDPQKVCLDNQCTFGKWIYGPGTEYTHLQQYQPLRGAHKKFHETAAEVVQLIIDGHIKQAESVISPSGRYLKVSEECVGLIREIKNVVAK